MHPILKSTMHVEPKAARTLLLVLMVWSISSTLLLSLPSVQGRATECPMHRQSSPLRSPVDHSCCQSSHDTAVLQKAVNPKSDVAVAVLLSSDQKPIPQDVFALIPDETDSPGSPPAKLQLRV